MPRSAGPSAGERQLRRADGYGTQDSTRRRSLQGPRIITSAICVECVLQMGIHCQPKSRSNISLWQTDTSSREWNQAVP